MFTTHFVAKFRKIYRKKELWPNSLLLPSATVELEKQIRMSYYYYKHPDSKDSYFNDDCDSSESDTLIFDSPYK